MYVFTVEIFNNAMFTQQNYSLCYALCSLTALALSYISQLASQKIKGYNNNSKKTTTCFWVHINLA